jgi:hypothetical protein
MKINVFWDVAPHSLVEIDRRFRGAYCLYYQGNEDNQTARRNIPEDSNLQPENSLPRSKFGPAGLS